MRIIEERKNQFTLNQREYLNSNFFIKKEFNNIKKKREDFSSQYLNYNEEELEKYEINYLDKNLNDNKMKEIIEKNKLIKKRDKELENILNSIIELNDMFKECNSFVIHQGIYELIKRYFIR
jgi:hypothetical protein